MKSYIAFCREYEPVSAPDYPEYNSGSDTIRSYYAVINEDEIPENDGVEISFIMWTDGISVEKVEKILTVLNSK